MGRQDPDGRDCGDGIAPLMEGLDGLGSSNLQILRSYHEAAANLALATGQVGAARGLVEGLANRIESLLDRIEAGNPSVETSNENLTQLILHAANVGVPLTWREVRWLHARIDEAHLSYLDPSNDATYRVFDAATPDGVYPFDPWGSGFDFKDLGLLLGACASQYRNPAGHPALDCARVLAAR
jgi:hypothetical protein